MATISAKLIKNPRIIRRCQSGFHTTDNLIYSNAVRLYGSACGGDPLYVMWICKDCASINPDPKIKKAVA